jgi:RNA polymerase sigma-70 factor, ECF subfamily
MALPDAAFLDKLRQRDPEALGAVVREHAADLYRTARGLGLQDAEAEDLVQATFVVLLDSAGRFEGRSSLRTYLFGILYRKALEQGRRRSRELAVDPADQLFEQRFTAWGHWAARPKGPDEESAAAEISRLLGQCLDELNDQQRAAFQLKEIEGEDNASICNALGVTDTHLRVLLFRARNRLRECVEKRWL